MSASNSAQTAPRVIGRPFVKGETGNPNGRPKVVFEIRDLARQFGPAGIAKLAEMAGLAPGTPAEAEATRVVAIKELLDRGYGKAAQLLAGEDGGPLTVVLRHLVDDDTKTIEHEPIPEVPE
jgi:hypothetical protein